MILFYGEGRLGNQIFQYQAICAIVRSGERIMAAGLEDLPDSFQMNGPALVVLTRSRSAKRLMKYLLVPLLRRIARTLRLVDYVFEPLVKIDGREQPGGDLQRQAGFLRGITFVDGGHYQNPSLWLALFSESTLSLKPAVRDAARRLLGSTGQASETISFVHVRRGDYLNYKVYGVDDVCLPVGFYRSAIEELRRQVGPTHLVFITDDARWVEEHLGDVVDKTILCNDALTDFAVMTECRNGIVSNSTFSLAAALIMPAPGLVLAPKYWFGFSAGVWYPPGIRCDHPNLLYLPVLSSK